MLYTLNNLYFLQMQELMTAHKIMSKRQWKNRRNLLRKFIFNSLPLIIFRQQRETPGIFLMKAKKKLHFMQV